MTRVCVVVTARPSWAKLQTICEALRDRADSELQLVVCASALLERYGNAKGVIQAQGFRIAAEAWSTYEGANLLTSAKETGALLCELAAVLRGLRPNVVVVCADRHEVLGVAQAASYQHIGVAHLQGGERTGSIDDRVRDSVTSLSDYHFPCTELAAFRVYNLTGAHGRIWNTGCSSIDLAKRAQSEPAVTMQELGGSGQLFDLAHPFLLVLQHPVTSEANEAEAQMHATLEACGRINLPRVVLWPGQDAGADGVSKAIRAWREQHPELVLHTVRNLPPSRFLRLLTQASVLVGNSSAGIRESAYLGVPVVNLGTRQQGRQRAQNVVDAPHEAGAIVRAIRQQIAHGKYSSSALYGTGDAGQRIAEVLAHVGTRTDSSAERIEGYCKQEFQGLG